MLRFSQSQEGTKFLEDLRGYVARHKLSPTEFEDMMQYIASARNDLPDFSVSWELYNWRKHKEKHPNLVFDEEIIFIIKKRNKGCENKSERRTPSIWLEECAIYYELLKKYGFKTPEGSKLTNKYFCEKLGLAESRISGRYVRDELNRKRELIYDLEKTIQFRLT